MGIEPAAQAVATNNADDREDQTHQQIVLQADVHVEQREDEQVGYVIDAVANDDIRQSLDEAT